jgi:hypothetical protein
MSVTIHADMAGLDRMIDMLAADVEEAARPAAFAGADVIYREVKRNVAALGRVSGNLDRSIYRVYSKDNSGRGRATYHISWNARKAPHGHLVEYGHFQRYRVFIGKDGHWYTDKSNPLAQPRRVAAAPFVRPAQAKFPEAVAAAEAELFKRIGAL